MNCYIPRIQCAYEWPATLELSQRAAERVDRLWRGSFSDRILLGWIRHRMLSGYLSRRNLPREMERPAWEALLQRLRLHHGLVVAESNWSFPVRVILSTVRQTYHDARGLDAVDPDVAFLIAATVDDRIRVANFFALGFSEAGACCYPALDP